jgi:hypothetical protein
MLYYILFLIGLNSDKPKLAPMQIDTRPARDILVHRVGNLVLSETNYGVFGDEDGNLPNAEWPSGSKNEYLFHGILWVGAIAGEDTIVTGDDWGSSQWAPTPGYKFQMLERTSGISMQDILAYYDDMDPATNRTKSLGIKVKVRMMSWGLPEYDDFIAYEFSFIHPESPDLPDTLKNVFIGFKFDSDVSSADPTNPHQDDLVDYDGEDKAETETDKIDEWDPLDLNSNGNFNEPDGYPDEYTIYKDDSGNVQKISRSMSYIYDEDDASTPQNDTGEGGGLLTGCPGYSSLRLIYADPTLLDTIPSYYSHTWWNIESDPGTDPERYAYMNASHVACSGYRYMPNPHMLGAPTFDYRFLSSIGPYEMAPNDTIRIVVTYVHGYGLNGGYDTETGDWVDGARTNADRALLAYYEGSDGDPLHPVAPDFGNHWILPIPPPPPNLSYSAGDKIVRLVWDDVAEHQVNPLDPDIKFAEYKIFRAIYQPYKWSLIDVIDSNMVKSPNFNHTYIDTTVDNLFPYFYTVTARNSGRPALIDGITGEVIRPQIPAQESERSNYMRDEIGEPLPVYPQVIHTQSNQEYNLEDIKVVPNPYRGSSYFDGKYEKLIYFINLPPTAKITIYTISGDLVQTINHDRSQDGPCLANSYCVEWNLVSRNEQLVQTGVYLFLIESQWGSKLGKFMIFR